MVGSKRRPAAERRAAGCNSPIYDDAAEAEDAIHNGIDAGGEVDEHSAISIRAAAIL